MKSSTALKLCIAGVVVALIGYVILSEKKHFYAGFSLLMGGALMTLMTKDSALQAFVRKQPRKAVKPDAESAVAPSAPQPISANNPLVIRSPALGLLNLLGPACTSLLAKDLEVLGDQFSEYINISVGKIPQCHVLFVYCKLESTGRISGQPYTLRDLIKAAGARIAVVASESGPDLFSDGQFGKFLGATGDWPANIVITLDRNGDAFGLFFSRLFAQMRSGTTMPNAWVRLAPQGPNPNSDVPGTVAALEVGHIVFGASEAAEAQAARKTLEQNSFATPTGKKTNSADPKEAALLKVLSERRKKDPLVGAKLGAREIAIEMRKVLKSENELRHESILCALGSLGGYSCQAYLRALSLAKGINENAEFVIIGDKKKYFFGDPLNNLLVWSRYSIWVLGSVAAMEAGATELLDYNDIFKHNASVVGGDQFGIPRLPEQYRSDDTPINYLKTLWPSLLPTVKRYCPNPTDWPILFGFAIQRAIASAKAELDPGMALRIVMESAIPMSKVDISTA